MSEFVKRTVTGAIYVVLLVASTLASPLTFAAFFAAVAGATVWEFSTNVNRHFGASANRLIGTVAAVYLFLALAAYVSGYQDARVFIPYLVTLVYLLISELYLPDQDHLKSWGLAFAAQVYVALGLALLSVVAFQYNPLTNATEYVGMLPLAVFVFLWVSDTGAFLVGSLLGRRLPWKLFPRISPHKTWVGSCGGALLCVVAAVVFYYTTALGYTLGQWVGLGLTVCVFGTWGDLVESQFKRQLGVKDSGHVLPGHGGLLDRFDSALLAIPAAVLYLYTCC